MPSSRKNPSKKPEVLTKGKRGKDPRGVEYISFEMPYKPEERLTFGFTSPSLEDDIELVLTNSKDIMGFIVLFEKKKDDV